VTSRKARDRFRCTSEAIELVRGARYGVGKRRRASGGSERGVLTCGAGGRAFENRLIARRSSTAAVGAGTADVDDRVKGNGSRLVRCGRRSAACRAGQPSRSLRQAPRPAGPPPLFAPTTEKWKKTADEIACSRGNCAAATFGDVAARNRNETADSGRLGAESAAAGRRTGGARNRQRNAPPIRSLVTIANRIRNPPYLIQISTSQRKSALLRRRVSARESSAPKSKSPRSRVEAHDTKNHRIDRSLAAKRQTLRGGRLEPGPKDAPRRDLSNDTSIAVFTQGGKNSTAEKPTKNRPFSAEIFKVRCDDASNKGERRAWERVRFTKTRDAGPRTNGAITYRAPSYARARSVRTSPFEPFERDISKTAHRRRSESTGDP
jgi:hypothetical protein